VTTPAYNLALAYIIKKWDLSIHQQMPVLIPGATRINLTLLFAELGYQSGAEIGTNRGSFALKISRNNPQCTLYCVDPWTLYDGMRDFTDAKEREKNYATAKKRLDPLPSVHIIKKFSMEALEDFEDGSLDFVYIDANHEWPFVTQDIFYWSKKVRSGGIVSGHDYLTERRDDGFVQVKEVVDAYTKAFDIKPWFVMDKCTIKKPGTFFWVKP